jgi:hypothetical protein
MMALLCGVALTLCGTSQADTTTLEAQIQELIKIQHAQNARIEKLMKEVENLKSGQAEIQEEQTEMKEASPVSEKAKWAEKISMKGDFRYRHEYIDMESKKDRTRHRVRARIGINAAVSDNLDLGFQLASGSMDPLSANQTLDTSFTSKDIWIDLAYADWHPSRVAGLHVIGGKMKNPFYTPGKTELIWDGDMRPEGIALTYARSFDKVDAFASGGGFWVEERSSSSDTMFWGAQAGLKAKVADERLSLLGGVSLYHFEDVEGLTPIFGGSFFGNSALAGVYAEDYTEVELFGELGFKVGRIPVTLLGDYVTNTEADDDDDGWLLGFKVGKTTDPGSWELKYNYRDIEADAVLGQFADSDFSGGGTDGRGHEIGAGYQASKKVKLGATYFVNDVDPDGADLDYDRLQLDVNVKF